MRHRLGRTPLGPVESWSLSLQRRVAALRDLGTHAIEAKSTEEACRVAAETLARHAKDVPFALVICTIRNARRRGSPPRSASMAHRRSRPR